LLEREARSIEALFLHAVADWEAEKNQKLGEFAAQESQIRGQIEQAGKEYSQSKYRLERDTNTTKDQLKRVEEEYRDIEKKYGSELARVTEENTNLRISLERQKSALTEMYQEKMRNLTVTRAGLLREWQNLEIKVKAAKDKAAEELNTLTADGEKKINQLKDSSAAKREGWGLAIDTVKRELSSLAAERDHVQNRLAEIKGEKEKELEAARLAMKVSAQQLEVDKATLIEKAEEDQRRCEAEVADLKTKAIAAERELQDFVMRHDQAKKRHRRIFP
jgi:chromosome segregation ATPase